MSANEKQVGGGHYRSELQHWDMLVELGYKSEYYVGQTTKYISRWRKKNGLPDFEKAMHFVEKLIELTDQEGLGFLQWGYKQKYLIENAMEFYKPMLARFFAANDTGQDERDFCCALIFASSIEDLQETLDAMRAFATQQRERIAAAIPGDFEFISYVGEDRACWRNKKTGEKQDLLLNQPPTAYAWR